MFWRLWGGLRSLRFALVLMVLIALACIVGTLVRQQPYDPHRAMDTYGRSIGLLVGLLGLNHLYYTWWFLALLLLFVLSTVACTLPRLRLRRRMLGSAIVHLSIVFIVVGAMLRGLIGVEGKVQINEGQTVDEFWVAGSEEPTPLGFKLRLDDFDLRHYEEVEDVLVVRFERTEASRLIRVGRDDIVSFQRGRGPVQRLGSVADLRVTPRTIKTQNLPAKAGKIAKLRDYDATVEVLQVLPDFTLPGSGGAHGASHAHSSPALEVCVRDAAGEHTGWVLLNEWGFHP
ncbi:cytochrome c biogenesis protein ResB, partial [bacterium]|nr:cytochrome c biogenesis protein ResB [bacterium]